MKSNFLDTDPVTPDLKGPATSATDVATVAAAAAAAAATAAEAAAAAAPPPPVRSSQSSSARGCQKLSGGLFRLYNYSNIA